MSTTVPFVPWPTRSVRGFAPSAGALPAEPAWPKLKCKVLVPFLFREEFRSGGRALPLGPTRVLEVGEIVAAIEPDARSWEASKWVQILDE
jgi:hypothetical protein